MEVDDRGASVSTSLGFGRDLGGCPGDMRILLTAAPTVQTGFDNNFVHIFFLFLLAGEGRDGELLWSLD
jgi:hypothetical protein